LGRAAALLSRLVLPMIQLPRTVRHYPTFDPRLQKSLNRWLQFVDLRLWTCLSVFVDDQLDRIFFVQHSPFRKVRAGPPQRTTHSDCCYSNLLVTTRPMITRSGAQPTHTFGHLPTRAVLGSQSQRRPIPTTGRSSQVVIKSMTCAYIFQRAFNLWNPSLEFPKDILRTGRSALRFVTAAYGCGEN
jgi:hypothetical protein